MSLFEQNTTNNSDCAQEAQEESKKQVFSFIITCRICNKAKSNCTCLECNLCGDPFFHAAAPDVLFGRHHCRSCFRPICSSCRDEAKNRWNPRFDYQSGNVRYCKRCAPLKGLGTILKMEMFDFTNCHQRKKHLTPSQTVATSQSDNNNDGSGNRSNNNNNNNSMRSSFSCDYSVWNSNPKRGLMLLFESMNCPRRCIDVEKCGGTLTDALTCPSCAFPTVSMTPFVEKMPKSTSQPESVLHLRTLDAEMRQDRILADRFAAESRDKLNAMEEAVFDEKTFWCPPGEITPHEFRDVIFACLASSVCYEYNRFPRMMLNATDCPAAKLMRPIEVHASFTIFEASGDRILIAFPGTHDVRTILNDLNAGRTFVQETSALNNGRCAVRHRSTADAAAITDSNGFQEVDDDNDDDDENDDGSQEADKEVDEATRATIKTQCLNGGVTTLHGYKVHTGFLRAATLLEHRLPSSTIKRFIASGKRIVVTGHSCGAALANLITLRLLRSDPDLMRGRTASDGGKHPLVQCIGFGTPLIGNSALKNRIHRAGLSHLFLQVVHRTDIVPRLLTVRRAHEEAIESVRNKVEQVKNKVVAAGSNLMSKISSFFSSSSSSSGGNKSIAAVDDTNSRRGTDSPDHAHKSEKYPVSPSLCAVVRPDCNVRAGSRSPTPIPLLGASVGGGGGAGPKEYPDSRINGNSNNFYLDPATTSSLSSTSNSSPLTSFSAVMRKDAAARSTIETVRAMDLDDEDIHDVMTTCSPPDEFSFAPPLPPPLFHASRNQQVPEKTPTKDPLTSVKKTSSHNNSDNNAMRRDIISTNTAKAPAPFHHPVATTPVKVKSPFDTFGRYLFLAPTSEGLQISSPKSSRINSASTLEEFPDAEATTSTFDDDEKNQQRPPYFEPTCMRVTCMLVDDPAESFGVLRNTSGSWMKSVEDHWLDGYQKALMMACFKG